MLSVTQGTAVEGGPEGTPALTLSVYPNPARGRAEVVLTLPEAQSPSEVEVTLYDLLGRRVAVLFSGTALAGEPVTSVLDARVLPAGVYVVRVAAHAVSGAERGHEVRTARLTLVR